MRQSVHCSYFADICSTLPNMHCIFSSTFCVPNYRLNMQNKISTVTYMKHLGIKTTNVAFLVH